MNQNEIDHVRDRLLSYADAIRDIEEYIDQPDRRGQVFVSPAYHEKYWIPILFSAVFPGGDTPEEFTRRYNQLTSELSALELRNGLRKRVLSELKYLVETWHAALCHNAVCSMEPCDVREISRRELIGVLLEELRDEAGLPGIKRMVGVLDEASKARIFQKSPGEISTPGEYPRSTNPENPSLHHFGIREE